MLFEKFSKHLDKAVETILGSNLHDYLTIEIFNELDLSTVQMNYLKDKLRTFEKLKEVFKQAGGYHSNPFNFTYYLNDILFKKQKVINTFNFERFEIQTFRVKLKVWIRAIEKHEYNDEYLEEKFWFAFWLSSIPNGNIRFLARKLMFQLVKIEPRFLRIIFEKYFVIMDDYIKECIVHVLSSYTKNESNILEFFDIINDSELININSIHNIQRYMNKEVNLIYEDKISLLVNGDKKVNDIIFKFLRSIDFYFKYEYRLLNLDIYNFSKSNFSFRSKFLENERSEINEIKKEIRIKLNCDSNECSFSYQRSRFVRDYYLSKGFTEKIIDGKRIYLSWQKRFKHYLRRYNIKIKDIDKIYTSNSDEKCSVHKALDLSISDIEGSLSSNYYLASIDSDSDGDIGYETYKKERYNESTVLFYPVSIYNVLIDGLNDKISKSISIPKRKSKIWAKNYRLSIENCKNLVEPFNFQGIEWRLIYGKVQKEKKNLDGSLYWRDFYVLNLAVDEKFKLTKIAEVDREYTIETPDFDDDISNFIHYDFSRTSSVHNSSDFDNEFLKTDYNIPPTRILKYFNLRHDRATGTWRDIHNEIVIIVNNNTGHFYDEGVTGSIYMNELYFKELEASHNLKYFGFCERFWETGYNLDSSLQIELFLNGNARYYKHFKGKKAFNKKILAKCKKCNVYREENRNRSNEVLELNELSEIIKLYASNCEAK